MWGEKQEKYSSAEGEKLARSTALRASFERRRTGAGKRCHRVCPGY